jgi:hypothetical protein
LLTYGLPAVGDTTLAPVVPADAHVLIATRFPYLSGIPPAAAAFSDLGILVRFRVL